MRLLPDPEIEEKKTNWSQENNSSNEEGGLYFNDEELSTASSLSSTQTRKRHNAGEEPSGRGMLTEAQDSLAISILAYIYPHLRYLSKLGYKYTTFKLRDMSPSAEENDEESCA